MELTVVLIVFSVIICFAVLIPIYFMYRGGKKSTHQNQQDGVDSGISLSFEDDSGISLSFDDDSGISLSFDDDSGLSFDDDSGLSFDDDSGLSFDDDSDIIVSFDDDSDISSLQDQTDSDIDLLRGENKNTSLSCD